MNFPDDADGEALRTIAMESDMTKPMIIDFMVAVPNEAAAEAIANRALTRGYTPSIEHDDENNQWTCYCTKQMIPEYEAVVMAQQELDDLSRDLGGYSDGWGTHGNGAS